MKRRSVGFGGADWIFRQVLVQGLWEYFGLKKDGRETEPLDAEHIRLVDEVLLLAEVLPMPELGMPKVDLQKLVRKAVADSNVKLLREVSVEELTEVVEDAAWQAREEGKRG